jgi:hypothetical protein
MSNRKAPEAYMGGNLLAGDIFQMLGLPSIGTMTTPLQSITDSVMGPGSYQNFQNAGTKKLLDVFLKGAIGGGKRPRKARHVASPKVCRHKYPNRCKCPKGEGAGIFDNLKDYVKLWEPEKVLGKIGDLALGKVVKHALGGSAIAARVNGFVADPQVQKDIHKLFANAMTDMLVKHEKAGGAIPMDHPIMMELGPAISGSGRRRRMVAGSWTKWLNPLYLAKRALHATHIDRVINKIPIVGNVAAATGITGGSLVPFIPQNPRGLRVLIAKLRDMPDTLAHFEMSPFDLDFLETQIHPRMDPNLIESMYRDLYKKYEFGTRSNAVAIAAGRPRGRPRKVRGGAAPDFDNEEADRMPQKYHIEEWGTLEPPQHREDDERTEEGSVGGPMTKKERQAKYRHENREKLREKQRQYREAKKVRVI